VAIHSETYKGFVIVADVKQAEAGYVPCATVSRVNDFADAKFDVRPPALVYATAESALKYAILCGKDWLDELTQEFDTDVLGNAGLGRYPSFTSI